MNVPPEIKCKFPDLDESIPAKDLQVGDLIVRAQGYTWNDFPHLIIDMWRKDFSGSEVPNVWVEVATGEGLEEYYFLPTDVIVVSRRYTVARSD